MLREWDQLVSFPSRLNGDDAELFACYTLLRHKPRVIVCLDSGHERRRETEKAMGLLGCDWLASLLPETKVDEDALRGFLADLDGPAVERVFAPAVEEDGHEHHSLVGQLALDVFGIKVRPYMTYRRGFGRSKGKTAVIPTAVERAVKKAAINCYRSQVENPATAYWFSDESAWWTEWLG